MIGQEQHMALHSDAQHEQQQPQQPQQRQPLGQPEAAAAAQAALAAEEASSKPRRASSFELSCPTEQDSPTASMQATPAAATRPTSHHYQQQQQQCRARVLSLAAERRLWVRLLPPLLLLVIVSYMDRTNLSFASLQFSEDIHLSSTLYGLGSGAFFLAYSLAQIPSNLLLLRYDGPSWLSAITVAWGAAAAACAAVSGPVSFVLLRLLLGLCEAGALPGTWYYISLFFPADRTTVPYSLIETGITVSQVIAAPIAAALLLLDGAAGLRGWQWLFLVEGLMAVLLGCCIRFWLPTSIEAAAFLSTEEKADLTTAIAAAASAAAAGATAAGKASPMSDSVDDSSCSGKDTAPLLPQAAAAAAAGMISGRHDVQESNHCSGSSSSRSSSSLMARQQQQQQQRQSSISDALTLIHAKPAAVAAAATTTTTSSSSSSHSRSSSGAEGSSSADEQQTLLPSAQQQYHHTSSRSSRWSSANASPAGAATAAVNSADCSLSTAAAAAAGTGSSSSSSSSWRSVARVLRHPVVLYAGCWRILHDVPGNGILYWTPKLVQALLLASGQSGLTAVTAVAQATAAVDCLQSGSHNSSSNGRSTNGSSAMNNHRFLNSSRNSSTSSSNSNLTLYFNSSVSSTSAGCPGLLMNAGGAATGCGIRTPAAAAAAARAVPAGVSAHAAAAAVTAASPGVAIVLLSAIPYAAASLYHLVNAWHSQKQGERRLHIALTWLAGAAALMLLPLAAAGGLAATDKNRAAAASASAAAGGDTTISTAASVAAFVLLIAAHVGVNGANGLQTGLVAGCIDPADKALGLAAYNTIGCIGSFFGPLLIGVLHDATGGYVVAMLLLGCSLAAAAGMVFWFDPARLMGLPH